MTIVRRAHELPAGGCVVVPTMGALHRGHAALVRLARSIAGPRGLPVVVTVFVNPTQFNEKSDYDRYPRPLDDDARTARDAGADFVYAPSVDEVYPGGAGAHSVALPRVATAPGLEDRYRPGHFEGVCQVVLRLFDLTRARRAVFGEKDWQQLQVVRALVAQAGAGVEIIPASIVRDDDGLALSSRNVFLKPDERLLAVQIPRALGVATRAPTPEAAELALQRHLRDHLIEWDYAVARDAGTLESPREGADVRLLVTARVGSVRLLDNAPWDAAAGGQGLSRPAR